jgi:enediyne biosynthesis protein E8
MQTAPLDQSPRTMTLEAFADTILPGEKRWPEDRAIAGVSVGGGAVASGAVPLLETEEGGMAPALDDLARMLNEHADAYIKENELPVDDTVPAFVQLDFDHRIALAVKLLDVSHPERAFWAGLAMFCNMAFDTGAHMHTVDAIAAGHPGLTTLGFFKPDPDGLWRFPDYSYGRPLATTHPNTTSTGSPA